MTNTDALVCEYFRKCFFSVDGLWFLKLEEASSFEHALEIDTAVWTILPKIQARTIQKLLGLSGGMSALQQAFAFKLEAETYASRITDSTEKSFTIEVHACPWVRHITRAGRGHLLETIADAICPVEQEAFARAFVPDIHYTAERKGCLSGHHCRMHFRAP
jgi:hypothetical protein